MPTTALPIIDVAQPFATFAADAADFVLTAADTANGNHFQCTGREVLIVQNSGASPYTFTATSVPDDKNRSGDISAYSLAAGEFARFGVGLTNEKGWKQTSGEIRVSGSNVAIKFAVLRLP